MVGELPHATGEGGGEREEGRGTRKEAGKKRGRRGGGGREEEKGWIRTKKEWMKEREGAWMEYLKEHEPQHPINMISFVCH